MHHTGLVSKQPFPAGAVGPGATPTLLKVMVPHSEQDVIWDTALIHVAFRVDEKDETVDLNQGEWSGAPELQTGRQFLSLLDGLLKAGGPEHGHEEVLQHEKEKRECTRTHCTRTRSLHTQP